jgi:DNA-binding response OmpR family regulator
MTAEPPTPSTPASPVELTIEHFGTDFDPPARILVADDDEMFGSFLTEFFRREGCHADRVLDSAAAEKQLRENEYDLLVSDIFMPGNVRLELIEQLPQFAGGLPVILLTGRPSVETAARSARLPVAAYLTKPPDLIELRNEARKAILNRRNLRTLALGRERLKAWQSSLEEIEILLRRAPSREHGNPWNRYLAVTLQNLLLTLLELKQFSENIAVADALGPSLRQAELLTAVQKTITVLRNTRQHFKSKDLGDLRHDLESLLTTTPPPPSSAASP